MEERKGREMEYVRKPFQGVGNIILFNWHYYLVSFIMLIVLSFLCTIDNEVIRNLANITGLSLIGFILVSLSVSYYIYDFSDLYKLGWLDEFSINNGKLLNINAGFDETSVLIKHKFRNSELIIFDFYDPLKHTEISIKRARQTYPAYPGTREVGTNQLPLANNSQDLVFVIFAAHEIRNEMERKQFFKELRRIIKSDGKIIVTEHLRDTINFLAYSIGFFHFYSRNSWTLTFRQSELRINKEIKVTPFTTTFILEKYGTTY